MPSARKPEDSITHSDLKKYLHYNPKTGIFVWLKNRIKVKPGDIAGTKDKYGYIVITIEGKRYKAHRLAWFYVHGEWPEKIDHEKHDTSNNRINGLRVASPADNSKNLSKPINNTSGIVGVYWCRPLKKWEARITVNRKVIFLGRHFDKFETICTRKSAERKYGFHENHGS